MSASKIYSTNFYLRNKYLNYFSIYNRYFCSKDTSVTSGGSDLKDDSSREKSDEETKAAASKKKESVQFKSTPLTEEKKEAVKQKLKSLLSDITITSERTSKSSLNLAKPLKRISKKERLAQMEAERITPEKELNMAVKAVASTFQEDSEKVESELKEKLTTLNLAQKDSIAEEVEATEDIPIIDKKVNENLMSSVEEVATAISENPIPPRSELAKRLMKISLDQKVSEDEKKSMRSVIESMVIKKKPRETKKVAEKLKQTEKQMPRPRPAAKRIEHVNLFGAAPLNIFDVNIEAKPDSTNTLWQKLQEREVRLLTQFAPTNAFDEMIMWTEQGKHWKFPIDNEADIGKEENVGFHEHVFLERHLKGFPTKGPIRHFMELVCVGLSKNPYITVDRKIENIDWFRAYFKEKEDVLRECGALD